MTESVVWIEPIVVVVRQSPKRGAVRSPRKIRMRVCRIFVEAREIHVQLQRLPQAACGLLRIARADQQIQRGAVSLQQVGGDVRADVSGGTGQEYRHVAPLVPVVDSFSVVRGRLARTAKLRARARFQRTPFDQRIGPLAQGGNMNVDPVIPPVNRARVVSESRPSPPAPGRETAFPRCRPRSHARCAG